MKRIACSASALALAATAAHAGGIERTTQSAQVLFEEGNHFELSFGKAMPELGGTSRDIAGPGTGGDIDNVAQDFTLPSAALKIDISGPWSAAFIFDRPFGADISYPDDDLILGGTEAFAQTSTLTSLLKYQINDNFSVYGGLRTQRAEGEITLRGAAYGAVSGYNVELDSDTANGYVLGAAYERPDIALRVALTYNSSIEHSMSTTESGPLVDPDGAGPLPPLPLLNGSSDTKVKTPESWNLEAQTGVAPGTLVFGSVRWVKHSEFRVDPERFETVTDGGLIDLEDTVTYRLGMGRQFTDKLAGSVSVAYEAPGDDLVSPLAPSTGFTQLAVGAAYDINETVTLSGGVSYTWLGDAKPETGTPDVARADFEDNDAWGVGMKIAFKF